MDSKILSNTYQKVADLIKKSHSILVITGAGISADSGLPTYRGVGGIYENQNTEDGLAIEDALSIEMFYKNPILVWKYIQQLVVASEDKTYNDAHKILAEIEKEKQEGEIVIARIDFKKVNKEYYDRIVELEEKLKKRTELLKRVVKESKETIDRKNKKMRELIEYIKKLHILLAYYKLSPEDFNKIDFTKAYTQTPQLPQPSETIEIKEKIIEYVPVEEHILED